MRNVLQSERRRNFHTVKDHVARFVKTYCYLIIAYLVCTFTGLHVGAFENPLT